MTRNDRAWKLPYWRRSKSIRAYDAFFQSQALDKLIAKVPMAVSTM